MANQRIPNDPYDPYRSGLSDNDNDFGRANRFDNDIEVDPELQEGPASSGKIALFAVGLALILGAVFYGLNNSTVKEAQTAPPAQTAQTQNAAPQGAPPGMRDVTPKASSQPNTQPGMTTGSAPSNPPSPPANK